MIHAIRYPRPAVLLLSLLSLLSVLLAGASAASAAPTPGAPAAPVLIGAAGRGDTPGTITVTGEDFTPGGRVYLALLDRWGATPDGLPLTATGPTAYGRNGSADPAAEPGGGGADGAAVGDWLTASPTVYGRNNSIDPAVGFSPGGAISIAFLIPCGSTMTVRAFDRSTASWSNWVDARPGC